MKNILFLGDSITDCNHCFTPDNLGDGYVRLIAEQNRDTHFVINGGTDGFTFPSIYRKWQRSYASRSFDIVSILGGINDIGAVMDSGMSESQIQAQLLNSGLALKKLLAGLQNQHVPLILLPEPFLFPYPHYLSTWMGRLDQLRTIIRQTARSLSICPASDLAVSKHPNHVTGSSDFISQIPSDMAVFSSVIRIIPLQPALDDYAKQHGFPAVTTDGIHLTAAGHQIVCDCILAALNSCKPAGI